MPTWYKAYLHFNIPQYSIFRYNDNRRTDYYINNVPIGVDHPIILTLTNNSFNTINIKVYMGVNAARGYRDDKQYKMKSNDPNNPDFLKSEDNTCYYHEEWDRWITDTVHVPSLYSVEEALPYFLKHNNLQQVFK